jgi:hypothetical protein
MSDNYDHPWIASRIAPIRWQFSTASMLHEFSQSPVIGAPSEYPREVAHGGRMEDTLAVESLQKQPAHARPPGTEPPVRRFPLLRESRVRSVRSDPLTTVIH